MYAAMSKRPGPSLRDPVTGTNQSHKHSRVPSMNQKKHTQNDVRRYNNPSSSSLPIWATDQLASKGGTLNSSAPPRSSPSQMSRTPSQHRTGFSSQSAKKTPSSSHDRTTYTSQSAKRTPSGSVDRNSSSQSSRTLSGLHNKIDSSRRPKH